MQDASRLKPPVDDFDNPPDENCSHNPVYKPASAFVHESQPRPKVTIPWYILYLLQIVAGRYLRKLQFSEIEHVGDISQGARIIEA